MNSSSSFVPFGTAHLLTLATIFAVSIGLPLALRRWSTEAWIRRVAVVTGVLAVAHELLKTWAWIFVWHLPWQEALPLELCGAAVFLAGIVLIWRSYRVYEVIYFWGLAGALQAMLTPEMPRGFPHLIFLTFFLSHGVIIFALFYATLAFRLRPTWASIPRTSLATVFYAFAVVAPLNLLLDTNYMFLRGKPNTESVLDLFGPWPWYLVGTGVFAVISFVFYYLPFWFWDLWQKRRNQPATG